MKPKLMCKSLLGLFLVLLVDPIFAENNSLVATSPCGAYIKLIQKYGRDFPKSSERIGDRLRDNGYPEIWSEQLVQMANLEALFQNPVVAEAIYRGLKDHFRNRQELILGLKHFSSLGDSSEQMAIANSVAGHLIQLIPENASKSNIQQFDAIAKKMKMNSSELKTFIQKLQEVISQDPNSLSSAIYSILYQNNDGLLTQIADRAKFLRRLKLRMLRMFGKALPRTIQLPAAQKISSTAALLRGDELAYDNDDFKSFLKRTDNNTGVFFLRSNLNRLSPNQLISVSEVEEFPTFPESLRNAINRRLESAKKIESIETENEKLSGTLENVKEALTFKEKHQSGLPEEQFKLIFDQLVTIGNYDEVSDQINALENILETYKGQFTSEQFATFAEDALTEVVRNFEDDGDVISFTEMLRKYSKLVVLKETDLRKIWSELNDVAKNLSDDSNSFGIYDIIIDGDWGFSNEYMNLSPEQLKAKIDELQRTIDSTKHELDSVVSQTTTIWELPIDSAGGSTSTAANSSPPSH